MSLLSDSDLVLMRSELAESLPEQAVILRETYARDDEGGGSVAWNAAGTLAARLAPVSGSEAYRAARVSEETTVMITLPALSDVDSDDRIAIDGRTYLALAVHAPRSYQLSTRVEAKELT